MKIPPTISGDVSQRGTFNLRASEPPATATYKWFRIHYDSVTGVEVSREEIAGETLPTYTGRAEDLQCGITCSMYIGPQK